MAEVPGWKTLLWPTLKALEALGGSAPIKRLDAKVADLVGATDEQRKVPHAAASGGPGRYTELDYRLAWCRTYLKGLCYIANPQSGHWEITQVGRKATEADMATVESRYRALRKQGKLPPSKPTDEKRSGEDVWRHVQHLAREHMESGDPVFTLERKTPNTITAVTDTRIHRHSAQALNKSGKDASVTKGMVVSIWKTILETGTSKGAYGLRFAFALVVLVPGIGVNATGDLYIKDATVAMQSFEVATASNPLLVSLLDQIRSLRRAGPSEQRTLHKPLMLLIALARLHQGEVALMTYDEVDPVFTDLARRLFPNEPMAHVAVHPFLRLENDGDFWTVDLRGADTPLTASNLRMHSARAGFANRYVTLLEDPDNLYEAVGCLLRTYFPEEMWRNLLDRLGLLDALTNPPPSAGERDYA